MNKFKLMFTAAAVFAVVGTALAVKPSFNQRICRAAPVGGVCPANLACAGTPINGRKVNQGNTDCVKVVSQAVTNCTTQLCTTLGTVVAE